MKLRHAAQVLILAALLAACGSEARVVQPPGCVDGLERYGEPGALDVMVGDAWFVGLERAQRAPWRRRVKAGIVVPAGGTLRLTVPPEARSLLGLSYGGEDPNAVRLSACHGHYPSAFFAGGLRVRRPLCRVPLDWRYGDRSGRLELSFGDAC